MSLPLPKKLGIQVLAPIDPATVASYIDWSPFFWAWELKGLFPKILEHPKWGVQARDLYDDARRLLDVIVRENRFGLRATIGFWPANRVGDSVQLYTGEDRASVLHTLHFLRQQKRKADDERQVYYSLADFVAPKGGGEDYLGAFAVTAGHEVEAFASGFRERGDDYSAIIIQALGDRMAEALAEYAHKIARDLWGFGLEEQFTVQALIDEKYRGIRPADGSPACPDHSEKWTLWSLLDVEANTGVSLTENLAMNPPSSVCGLYFSHPGSRYFDVGPLGDDQKGDYRKRKSDDVLKWLSV